MSLVTPSPNSVPFEDSQENVTGVLTKKRAALRSMANFRYFGATDVFTIGGTHVYGLLLDHVLRFAAKGEVQHNPGLCLNRSSIY